MDDIQLNNPKKKEHIDARICPHCGASVLSEVCQYCGTYLGDVATADLTAEYEMIQCKSAKFSFWRIIFPMFFALGFLGLPLCCFIPVFVINAEETSDSRISVLLFMIPFLLVGIGASVVMFKGIYQWLAVRFFGVVRQGTVYGYMDDTTAYNGVNGQVVKVLVQTNDGPKFIMLPLETTVMKYKVNSHVDVKLYKDYAVIIEQKVKW